MSFLSALANIPGARNVGSAFAEGIGAATPAVGPLQGFRDAAFQVAHNATNPAVNIYGQPNPAATPASPRPVSAVGTAASSPGVLGASTTAPSPSSSSYVDPTVAALYSSKIADVNNQIGALDPQLQAGKQNIQGGYNQALYNENLANDQATRDYNTAKQTSTQGALTAKNNIDSGVRQNTNALQRLLGLAGSGNSSASEVLAPYAASRAGDVQRQGVQTSFGQNQQALDTNYGDTQQKHQQNLGDLSTQEQNNLQDLQTGINTTRSSLLSSLASLTGQQAQAAGKTPTDIVAAEQPLLDQISNIIKSNAATGAKATNPVYNTTPTAFTAPNLSSYDVGSTGAPSASLPAGTNVSSTPYLAQLLGTKDKNGNPILG